MTWTRAEDTVRVRAWLEDGRTFEARNAAFDLALDALCKIMPPGAAPGMCATCALGFLDFFSGPDGFDDWSCYRDRPDLADALRHHGKHAPGEAFSHMHKVRVRAIDVCDGYEGRKRKGPLG